MSVNPINSKRPKGSILPNLPGMTLRRASEIARHIEAKEGKPPKGSLSALLRNDYKDSGSGEDVTLDLITFSQRTHHADWITRENSEMEAALVKIALMAKDTPALVEMYRCAREAMTQDGRDLLDKHRRSR